MKTLKIIQLISLVLLLHACINANAISTSGASLSVVNKTNYKFYVKKYILDPDPSCRTQTVNISGKPPALGDKLTPLESHNRGYASWMCWKPSEMYLALDKGKNEEIIDVKKSIKNKEITLKDNENKSIKFLLDIETGVATHYDAVRITINLAK